MRKLGLLVGLVGPNVAIEQLTVQPHAVLIGLINERRSGNTSGPEGT
jgi:hypothetical protein